MCNDVGQLGSVNERMCLSVIALVFWLALVLV